MTPSSSSPRSPWLLLLTFALLLLGAPASANSSWKVADLHLRASVIYGVDCTPTLCVGAGTGATPPEGIGSAGVIVSSRNPLGGASAWKVTHLPAGSLRNVACPSTRFCLIAGNRGRFFTSTDPTGGPTAWRPIQLEEGFAPVGLSCAGRAVCVVVGGYSIFAGGEPLGVAPWATSSDFGPT